MENFLNCAGYLLRILLHLQQPLILSKMVELGIQADPRHIPNFEAL